MTTAVVVRAPREMADAVRSARLAAGLSQAELAAEAHVGRQWLVGFEAGDKASAPLNMVWRLLTALDLTVVLVPTPVAPPRSTPPAIDLDEIIDGLRRPS